MKTNQELGYEPVYGQVQYALGDDRSWENAYDYPGTLSLHVTIGHRGREYRVYGYLWHNEQDASREYRAASCCGRATEIDAAISSFLRNAADLGWDKRSVDKTLIEMRESIREVAALK
jgi:hypothetical protein